jgi:hypothetical protein
VGALVSVAVEIEGGTSPLYAASDGSRRFYVQARRDAPYALRLANTTGERLAVAISVDGLNVISGERDVRAPRGRGPLGRMYVLEAWDTITVRGWRTSLDDVHRFTFVDERRSYATRSGKANARMGWIEVAVYRERTPRPVVPLTRGREIPPPEDGKASGEVESDQAARSDAGSRANPPAAVSPRAYPGTGWGERVDDAAMLVDFDPQPAPADRVTLRYEYASGLRALGIDVRPSPAALDRLQERDRGEGGFVKPPAW